MYVDILVYFIIILSIGSKAVFECIQSSPVKCSIEHENKLFVPNCHQ